MSLENDELKIIDSEIQEDEKETRWTWELILAIIVSAMIIGTLTWPHH